MGTITKIEGKRGTSYRVQLRHHGKFLQNISTCRTFKNYADAKSWMIDQEANYQKGGSPSISDPLKFSAVIDRYKLEVEAFKLPRTQETERHILQHWNEQLGHLNIHQISGTLIAGHISN